MMGGGQNHLYTLSSHQGFEVSLDVVTGMLNDFFLDIYELLDTDVTLSFITLYVSIQFGIFSE